MLTVKKADAPGRRPKSTANNAREPMMAARQLDDGPTTYKTYNNQYCE
jgi:hypothetical protein